MPSTHVLHRTWPLQSRLPPLQPFKHKRILYIIGGVQRVSVSVHPIAIALVAPSHEAAYPWEASSCAEALACQEGACQEEACRDAGNLPSFGEEGTA